LSVETTQLPKLQHIFYRKFREGKRAKFLKSIKSDNIALAIVGSMSTSLESEWVKAVPKAAAFVMAPPKFRTAMQNRFLIPHPQIIPNSKCSCKGNPTLDVRGIHLQKCKRLHGKTIKTHDILNEDIQFHKSMGLLSYKIQEDHFRILNISCGLRGDQIVRRAGQMPMLLDVTLTNVVTSDVANKIGKPLTGVRAEKLRNQRSIRRLVVQWVNRFFPLSSNCKA